MFCNDCSKKDTCNEVATNDVYEADICCPNFELREDLKNYVTENAYDKIVLKKEEIR